MRIRNILLAQSRRPARAGGFTLIEILLVIVIILMLAGALVVFVLPQQEGAEKNTTKLLLTQIDTALQMYRLNMGRYPAEEDGGLSALLIKPTTMDNEQLASKWQGPYLKPGTKLEDPWGNGIHYEVVDRTLDTERTLGLPYKLYSLGPDGQPDTDDDIVLVTEVATDGTGLTPSGGMGTGTGGTGTGK